MIIFYREVHFTCVLSTRTHAYNRLHYFNFITKYFFVMHSFLFTLAMVKYLLLICDSTPPNFPSQEPWKIMQVHRRNIFAEMMSVPHQHFQRSNASPFHPLKRFVSTTSFISLYCSTFSLFNINTFHTVNSLDINQLFNHKLQLHHSHFRIAVLFL